MQFALKEAPVAAEEAELLSPFPRALPLLPSSTNLFVPLVEAKLLGAVSHPSL
jgi:hypothetical protein